METDENKADTYFDSLTAPELVRFGTIHHPARRLEFAASRHLRTELFGKHTIHYSEIGAPFLEEQGFISLSHTHGLVGLAHSRAHKVGLDIESIREKAVALHTKFIHPSERECFDTSDAFDMSLLWSFKETLFKLAGRKAVHFSSDLVVRKEDGRFYGTVHQYDLTSTIITTNTN
jgi:4'-phosphopantetheinyl transferase